MRQLGVWEDLVELRKVSKEMFDLLCLLAEKDERDSRDRALIAHRIEQMRDSYSFLKDDVFVNTKKE